MESDPWYFLLHSSTLDRLSIESLVEGGRMITGKSVQVTPDVWRVPVTKEVYDKILDVVEDYGLSDEDEAVNYLLDHKERR